MLSGDPDPKGYIPNCQVQATLRLHPVPAHGDHMTQTSTTILNRIVADGFTLINPAGYPVDAAHFNSGLARNFGVDVIAMKDGVLTGFILVSPDRQANSVSVEVAKAGLRRLLFNLREVGDPRIEIWDAATTGSARMVCA